MPRETFLAYYCFGGSGWGRIKYDDTCGIIIIIIMGELNGGWRRYLLISVYHDLDRAERLGISLKATEEHCRSRKNRAFICRRRTIATTMAYLILFREHNKTNKHNLTLL